MVWELKNCNEGRSGGGKGSPMTNFELIDRICW